MNGLLQIVRRPGMAHLAGAVVGRSVEAPWTIQRRRRQGADENAEAAAQQQRAPAHLIKKRL